MHGSKLQKNPWNFISSQTSDCWNFYLAKHSVVESCLERENINTNVCMCAHHVFYWLFLENFTQREITRLETFTFYWRVCVCVKAFCLCNLKKVVFHWDRCRFVFDLCWYGRMESNRFNECGHFFLKRWKCSGTERVVIAQHCDCTKCPWTVHFEMIICEINLNFF